MEFEWHEDKRQWTLQHRGLDFADVDLVDFDSILTEPDLRRDYGEDRYNSLAYLDDTLISFCWTPRGSKIRIFSMRKANARERQKHAATQKAR